MPGSAVLAIPNQLVKTQGRKEATIAPMPMKKLCKAKPRVRWEGGSLSPTKARKGSMLTLMEASMIQSTPTAIHSVEEFGIISSAMDAKMAPMPKYGLLRPHFGCHVRSL